MARALRIEFENAFYHVIQRGTERSSIFINDADKSRFLSYLDSMHTAYRVIVHTYALMKNHYHMILQTPLANLSKAMHYLNTSYAAYFNTKRKRVGPLYQGRYKAILVQQDAYLHHLSSYIHLNPIRANIVKNPIEYTWSSYRYFVSKTTPPRWLDTSFILTMFNKNLSEAKKLYREFVLAAIGKEKGIIDDNTIKGFILGDGYFAKDIIGRFVVGVDDPELVIVNELKCVKEVPLERIKTLVAYRIKNDKRLQRKISLYLSRKYTQQTLNSIADFYGKIGDTGVSQAYSKTEKARKEDRKLDRLVTELEKEIEVKNGDATP